MLKKSLSTFLLLLLSSTLYGQYFYETLYMHNPQGWQRTNVDITEQVYSIHEKGNFLEVNQYLSFKSSNPTRFNEESQLELVTSFEIDEQIQLSNLWLWVGDQIVEAKMYDKWTAQRIYEDIVDRRKDPALLVKEGNGKYKLNIYPFQRDQIRKIRISYLIPNNRSSDGTSIKLPNRIQELSNEILAKPDILYWTEATNPELKIDGFGDISFIKGVSEGKTFYSAVVPDLTSTDLTMRSSNFSKPVVVSTYKDDIKEENYYSLSIIPTSFITSKPSKDVVFLIDLVPGNTQMSKSELLSSLKQGIISSLSEDDRFLLFAGGLDVSVLTNDWIHAGEASVDSLFSQIDEDDIGEVSNLNQLFTKAVDSLKESENIARIGFMSSSQTYHSFSEANNFLDAILEYIGDANISINIAEIQTTNFAYSWQGGRPYQGNEYLYQNLSRETGGEYYGINDNLSASDIIRKMVNYVSGGGIENVDLYTTTETGFTYSKYTSFDQSTAVVLGESIGQVGKFMGDQPFEIEVTGMYNNEIFNQRIKIQEEEVLAIDSTLKRYWAGHRISEIEQGNPTNQEITEAIELSLENRILSKYTAFLALEPSDTVSVCATCFDESELVDLEETEQPDEITIDSLYAYPNPFNPSVNINVELSESWDASNSSITIYNLLGKRVARLNTFSFQGRKEFSISWNIHDAGGNLATGIYFVRLQTPNTSKNLKITYVK